jgi:hypothetical protein
MKEQQPNQPSTVVPLLVAALVCDVAVADPSTNKKNLIGIFDRLNVGTFPTSRPMSVYIKLADAEGHYDVQVKYVERKTGTALAEAVGAIQVRDRLKSVDLYISFPALPVPREGRYEFQIWANGAFIGSTFLDAVPRPAIKA